jgi:hypothetical protein
MNTQFEAILSRNKTRALSSPSFEAYMRFIDLEEERITYVELIATPSDLIFKRNYETELIVEKCNAFKRIYRACPCKRAIYDLYHEFCPLCYVPKRVRRRNKKN